MTRLPINLFIRQRSLAFKQDNQYLKPNHKKGVVSLIRNTLVSLNPERVVTLNRNQVVTFSEISILQLMKRIEALAAKYHCEFDLTAKSELKHRTGTRSASELMNYAVRLYPELSDLYNKSVSNDHRYYKKLFEAVLSAHIFKERLRLKASKMETTIE